MCIRDSTGTILSPHCALLRTANTNNGGSHPILCSLWWISFCSKSSLCVSINVRWQFFWVGHNKTLPRRRIQRSIKIREASVQDYNEVLACTIITIWTKSLSIHFICLLVFKDMNTNYKINQISEANSITYVSEWSN